MTLTAGGTVDVENAHLNEDLRIRMLQNMNVMPRAQLWFGQASASTPKLA